MSNTSPEISPEIAAMSFEAALAELETIVRGLESGSAKLDEAVTSYERGAELKRHCEEKLKQAQAKIERLNIAADGSVAGAAPLDND
ncbi:MAG: exodeoxyribonuclease VII small subunit [Alphaproteobacteria bacterium]|nr:exodeoxyribonuclease VII small subunit [Alphaproteobacteria bacterium SS10]